MSIFSARLGCGLLVIGLSLAGGCAGAGDFTGAPASEGLQVSTLPNLPGCEGQAANGRLSARAIAGGDGLYVVYEDGRALCIDTLAGATDSLGTVGVDDASSNPMPGLGHQSWSNPMPGDPGDPAASNPMPGIDPGGSNPMPGTDPNRSGSTR